MAREWQNRPAMALTDLRYALRTLLKARGFALVTIATLAIGIGATTAIFAAVSAFFLRPLPYARADGIVRLNAWFNREWTGSVSEEDFIDWKNQSRTLDDFVAWTDDSFNLAADSPERIQGQRVTDGLFTLLGAAPAVGRTFAAEEFQPGADKVVVLSYGLWQRHFGGDRSLVGKNIDLGGQSYTVAGVMPDGFRAPGSPAELWVPHPLLKKKPRDTHYLNVLARLRPGATLEAARANMEAIAAQLAEAYPASNAKRTIKITPLRELFVDRMRTGVWVLGVAVVFVLLIGCANVANLLLARASSRRGEIAVRMALGANRARIIRQLLTESLVLGLVGGVLGALVATWGIDVLQAGVPPEIRPLFPFRIDGQVLAFTLIASIASAFLFGLAPALQSSRADLSGALRDGSNRTTGKSRLKKVLVVAEVALSVMLLIGAGLLIRSLARLGDVPLGFSPHNMLTLQMALPQARYADDKAQAAFYERLVSRVQAIPGVASAGVVNHLPLARNNINGGFYIQGRPPFPPGEEPITELMLASPDYFRTLGVRLLKGRLLADTDRMGTPAVAVVNETFVKRYLGQTDPIGVPIDFGDGQVNEIVGVISDVRRFGLAREPAPETYFAAWQGVSQPMSLAIRTKGDPAAVAGAVRAAVAATDPLQAVFSVKTMEQIVAESLAMRRFQTFLLLVFAGVALVLASLGIYGVMAYHVGQRRQEMGIRMALGARSGQLQGMVVGEGMQLAGIGLVIGIALAAALARLIESMLFQVGAMDVPSYALSALLLAGVALLACWLPARRATRIDPMNALRSS
jgi:predicted permease